MKTVAAGQLVNVGKAEDSPYDGKRYAVTLKGKMIGYVQSAKSSNYQRTGRGSRLIRYTGGTTTNWSATAYFRETVTGYRSIRYCRTRKEALERLVNHYLANQVAGNA